MTFGLLVLGSGCQRTGSVFGTVFYNGKALDHGNVQAMASDGTAHDGLISASGSYRFESLPCGPVRFAVYAIPPEKEEEFRRIVRRGGDGPEPEAPAPEPSEPSEWAELPENYADFSTSGLVLDVKPLEQEFDLNLQ
jgi:hypothetical protein